ncbi:acylphosphatase [Agromyces sp. CFH 90414]|uniref:acylphosphatase n=1 Tax=Agromyces agglutinans TaxID=2662258 RepID=A0A6I2FC39_9MICO|nr:acylphosphatase [Agromyces agglutinans]MRG59503.1 acylphosphatase [Agromyces agglutinans]
MRRVRVVVHGEVQGVGYRYATRRQARRRDLSGWVRNLPDGSVEAEIEGDDEMVESMLGWLAAGPPEAEVVTVTAHELEATREPGSEASDFRITH